MKWFFAELKRRHVFATVSIYVITVWLLMQIADVLFPGWGIPEERIRYLFYAAIACFPFACLVGWKYDISLHGLERTSTIAQGKTGTPLAKSDHLILAGMFLATIFILTGFGLKIISGRTLETDFVIPNSVAVLPLTNLSEEESNEYFSTGLWHLLIDALGHIQGFQVTPTTSAGYFRDRELDLDDIKRKLLVANVITGSVQKAANRVRITLSLTDTRNGSNLWSQSYDRDLGDIFAIQTDIAHSVAQAMKVTILGQEEQRLQTAPTKNVDALDLLMLANEADSFEHGLDLIDRAITLDPNYADAHLARAMKYLEWIGRVGGPDIGQVLEVCDHSIQTAGGLLRDPDVTSARYNWVKAVCFRRMAWAGRGSPEMEREMEAAFKRATKINPSNSVPHISYSIYLRRENRLREAEDQIRQALEIDRLYRSAMLQLARVLSLQGKDAESIEWNEKITGLFNNGYGQLANLHASLGRYDLAIEALARAPSLEQVMWASGGLSIRDGLFSNLWALRQPKAANQYQTAKSAGEPGGGLDPAWALARQGRYEQAFLLARDVVDRSGTTAWYVLNEPAELALLAGRFEDAISIYETAFPSLADSIRPDVNLNIARDALHLAHAWQQSGDRGRAAVLFGRLLDVMEGRRNVGFENKGIMDACIYASLGDSRKALAALRTAIDAGWVGLYDNKMMAPPIMLEALAGNPEYEAMVAEINAQLEVQFQRIKPILPMARDVQ